MVARVAQLGVPCVGSLYHLVLSNWRLRSRPEGGRYTNGELAGENLELGFHFLLPPEDREERTLFVSVVESEARGAEALRAIVALLSAAAREDVHQTVFLLEKLRIDIAAVSQAFATAIRKQHLKPDTFLTLIQPTLVWGLPEPRPRSLQATDASGSSEPAGMRVLDGASGSQTPIVQAIDAILGLQRRSHTGQLILKGRAYLLPEHRRFLGVLDDASHVVRGFVERAARPPLTELFNECVQGVQRWRKMHQKRGALYLRGETAGAASGYASVGGTVRAEAAADPARHFEQAMQQRLDETTAALFGADELRPHTVEAAFMYLTPDDRTALVAAAGSREYAADEIVLQAGGAAARAVHHSPGSGPRLAQQRAGEDCRLSRGRRAVRGDVVPRERGRVEQRDRRCSLPHRCCRARRDLPVARRQAGIRRTILSIARHTPVRQAAPDVGAARRDAQHAGRLRTRELSKSGCSRLRIAG